MVKNDYPCATAKGWFSEVFLQSLFERIGYKATWLTQKQTAVCAKYMTQNTFTEQQYQGFCVHHLYYEAVWKGRMVTLQYSKKSGTGVISFSPTEEERQESAKRHEIEVMERELKDLERRLRRHRDKFLAELQENREAMRDFAEYIQQDKADGDFDSLEGDTERFQKYQKRVHMMESVLAAAE